MYLFYFSPNNLLLKRAPSAQMRQTDRQLWASGIRPVVTALLFPGSL